LIGVTLVFDWRSFLWSAWWTEGVFEVELSGDLFGPGFATVGLAAGEAAADGRYFGFALRGVHVVTRTFFPQSG
jgi:hypothetical protein